MRGREVGLCSRLFSLFFFLFLLFFLPLPLRFSLLIFALLSPLSLPPLPPPLLPPPLLPPLPRLSTLFNIYPPSVLIFTLSTLAVPSIALYPPHLKLKLSIYDGVRCGSMGSGIPGSLGYLDDSTTRPLECSNSCILGILVCSNTGRLNARILDN